MKPVCGLLRFIIIICILLWMRFWGGEWSLIGIRSLLFCWGCGYGNILLQGLVDVIVQCKCFFFGFCGWENSIPLSPQLGHMPIYTHQSALPVTEQWLPTENVGYHKLPLRHMKEERAICPFLNTWPPRWPQMDSVFMIDRGHRIGPSHSELTASFAPFAPDCQVLNSQWRGEHFSVAWPQSEPFWKLASWQ